VRYVLRFDGLDREDAIDEVDDTVVGGDRTAQDGGLAGALGAHNLNAGGAGHLEDLTGQHGVVAATVRGEARQEEHGKRLESER
jgi:hypothetical protein